MSQINEKKIREMIDEAVEQRVRDSMPHICTYCGWFRMNTEVPHNRFCQFKGMLRVEGGICQEWYLAEDYKKRKVGDITV